MTMTSSKEDFYPPTAASMARLVRASLLNNVLSNIRSRASQGIQWTQRTYETDMVKVDLEALGYVFGEKQVVWGIAPYAGEKQ